MIVAVATQKGGSAKTTTVVNLGAALAASGQRTLVVDLDGQGHASYWLLGAATSALTVSAFRPAGQSRSTQV
jgi:chromosome partitioning protein